MLFSVRIRRSAVIFSLRATLAAWIALVIAFALNLDSPGWAAVTVCVVAQPSRGMTLSKSLYRLLGTAVGAVMGMTLIAFFGGSPFYFVVVLSVWMALTTLLANMVRYFRAYAAVLAGYTASIVGLLAYRHPDHVYEMAKARLACVLLGVIVTSLVTLLTAKSETKKEFLTKINAVLAKALEWPSLIFLGRSRSDIVAHERRILVSLREMDELMAYAAAESLQLRMQSRQIYGLLGSLYSVLSATRALDSQLGHESEGVFLIRASLQDLGEILDELGAAVRAEKTLPLERFAKWKKDFAKQRFQLLETAGADRDQRQKSGPFLHGHWKYNLFDRLHELMVSAERALFEHRTIQTDAATQLRLTRKLRSTAKEGIWQTSGIWFHRDWQIAQRVGIRSGLAVLAAGLIWCLTGWPSGPLFLMMTAINCGLFATSNQPVKGLITMFYASIFSVLAAFLCHRWFLTPEMSTPALLLALGVFLIPGGIVAADAKNQTAGMLYNAFFMLFVGSLRPVHFELETFVGTAAGFFASIVLTYAVFKLVLPTDPTRRMSALADEIVHDLERLARSKQSFDSSDWETKMYTRVSQLIELAVEAAEEKTTLIDGALAALDIGREILRLKNLLKTPAPSLSPAVPFFPKERVAHPGEVAEILEKVLASLGQISSQVGDFELLLKNSVDHLAKKERSVVELRAATCLQDMADAMKQNRAFFMRGQKL